MIHVYPTAEKRLHELRGTTCECGVVVDWSEAEAVVSHNSLLTTNDNATPWTCDPLEGL
jgi:hypothetical protein